jgi:hypothetical protein
MTFDPNGGDMGRASLRPISPFELYVLVPHIAHILQELYKSGLSKLPFKYAFEFPPHFKNELTNTIILAKAGLPQNVSFYEIDGKVLFEMRGQSGGVTTGFICYLYTHP